MKTFICAILLSLPFMNALAFDSNREIKSMQLVNSLVIKLQKNTPFSYSDEEFYLGGLMGFTILSQLGYQDKAGRWLKSKPKYSYLGELLRLKRQLIIPPKKSSFNIYLSSNIIYGTNYTQKTYGKEQNDKTFIYVTLNWTSDSNEAFLCCTKNNYMTITFKVFAPVSGYKKLIYFDDILVNGKPLPYLLGFRRKNVSKDSDLYVPYLPKKDLEALKLHISKLK